jgi:Tol biopolymer transport system component
LVGGTARASIPPGTNGKVVFGQVEPNYGFTIDPDGSDEHQIGPPGRTTCNSSSPDGSKVLCNLWSDAGVQPATANPNGSDFTLLNPNLPLDLSCQSWSRDGTRLLCHSEDINQAGLYTVRSSDAGDVVRVSATPPTGFDNGYGYSPDGSRVLFARYDSDDRGTLFSVAPDGGGALRLTPPRLSIIDLGFFDRVGADWSPDGSQVTFAAVQKRSTGRGSRARCSPSTRTGPAFAGSRQPACSPPPPSGHRMANGSRSRVAAAAPGSRSCIPTEPA